MSVAAVSNTQSQNIQGLRSTLHQARQDFSQIYQSLQSGDLASAQQAYSSIQSLQASIGTQTTSSSTNSTGTTATTGAVTSAPSTVATDWTALGQALQSGSLSTAQSAFSTLQQDASTAAQTQMQQAIQNAQSVYQLMGNGVQGTLNSSASTGNPVSNDLNALAADLQSGNTSNAQTVLAQLQQDLQSAGQQTSGQQTFGQGFGRHHHHAGMANTVLSSLFGANSTTSTSTATSATTTPTSTTGSTSTGATATS